MNDITLKEAEACVVDLEALKRRCLGNTDLVARVLKKFAIQLDNDLAELAKALSGSDAESFALVAHRIKGMSANIEARDLSRHAAAAEQCALDREVSELPFCLERMRQERTRIAKSLQRVNIHS
jgi:HPt (histidine-containing phosphotransfer) domain-containing protein